MTKKQKGNLFVISAPSGAGKTSLIRALIDNLPNLMMSISHTTRKIRPGEIDGVHYHYVSDDEFNQLLKDGEFVEHAEVFGHQYGTSRVRVEELLEKGIDILLEIDWQGARQIKEIFPADSVSVFILPPSMTILEERLKARQQDAPDVIMDRMALAKREISHFDEYDYVVINESFEHALQDMKAIVQANRLTLGIQQERNQQLLQELLAK